jgi:NAD-dependent deacetylase
MSGAGRERGPAVVVLTGAGVSADSGIATFRGPDGLWEGRRPEEVATPQAWRRDRAGVWRFYQTRRARLRTVEPNAAHRALARLERELAAAGVPFTLVSQNVDDLHQRAGSTVLAMHGQLADLVCERCRRVVRDLEHTDPERFVPCAACGHDALRPDVVWFGEVPYHVAEIERRVTAATWFLALGTSGVVWPAAGMLELARLMGARTIVQALEPPENVHPRDRFVAGRAAEVVPGLVDELLAELSPRERSA